MNADPKDFSFLSMVASRLVYAYSLFCCSHWNWYFSVSGVWEPLLSVSQQCRLTIEPFFGVMVITAPYTGPCVELKVVLTVILWSWKWSNGHFGDFLTFVFSTQDDERLLFMLSVAGELTFSCPAGLHQTEPVTSGYPLYPPQPPTSPTAATTMSKQTHSPKPSSQATHMPRKGDPQVPQMPEFHPFYPYRFPPYPPQQPYFPTSAPTTSPKQTNSPQPATQALHMPPKGDPQVPQIPDLKMFYPYHFTTHPPQPYFPSASTTTPKQKNQALHMPPKGYPQVPLSYQFPQYNFPGFFPQRSVPRAPPIIASQLDNQNNPQKYHYSDLSYSQKSATPPVTAGTTPQAQPKQSFMQYDQYPMVRSWNPYASALFSPHYGTALYHY